MGLGLHQQSQTESGGNTHQPGFRAFDFSTFRLFDVMFFELMIADLSQPVHHRPVSTGFDQTQLSSFDDGHVSTLVPFDRGHEPCSPAL